jgi:hypothetical protein
MNEMKWSGLDALREQLRRLPADLAAEAAPIVTAAAEAAATELRGIYLAHEVSGNLANHVVLSPSNGAGQFGARVVLKSTGKHAWLFDNGSQARHYVRDGNDHKTGQMWGHSAPTHVAVTTIMKHRRQMEDALRGVVARAGFTVTG